MNLTTEQLQAAEQGPVTVEAEGKTYVLLSKEVYERMKQVTYSPLTVEEEDEAFRQAGELAGWDDPEMDVYNKFAPEKS